MSSSVLKTTQFPQPIVNVVIANDENLETTTDLPVLGGIFSDPNYCWQAKGPYLEVKKVKTGRNVGAWTFGGILKDSSTKIVCVDEIQKAHGRLSILAVGVDCAITGSTICLFDVFGSKVIRSIQIRKKITSLHVVDSGLDNLNLPGPLRNFDGILAVGTVGGGVYIIDMCRQICEEALDSIEMVADELRPSQISLLNSRYIPNIEYHRDLAVTNGDHLAIHLNAVVNSVTEHFTLKGPKGEDRLHVNKEEAAVSALFYCPQLTSILVGYNFGAYQLWNLVNLFLIYTSSVCEEHIPVTKFATQEPSDDPRAYFYVWITYSPMEMYYPSLPYAVMQSFCYDSKQYHEGYGYLYVDFQYCSTRLQIQLSTLEDQKTNLKVCGGCCTRLEALPKTLVHKEVTSSDESCGDNLTLCLISWTIWFSNNETNSFMLIFDLNQWYKEQMPNLPNWKETSNYILHSNLSELLAMSGKKGGFLYDVKLNRKTLRQFLGVQKMEEHFLPTSLSFDLTCLREQDVVIVRNESLQRSLLSQIESAGPLCLLRPIDFCQQVLTLGLLPLFVDHPGSAHSLLLEQQRKMLLDVGLEQILTRWLCRCASEWANGSFSSAGCSLEFLINWAFQRAVLLKSNCDKFCVPLFDYSETKLDNNTTSILNNCIRQLNNLKCFYSNVLNNLINFLVNPDVVLEQFKCIQTTAVYFEVLQWLVNVGLLPECDVQVRLNPENYVERVLAPYPVKQLTDYYYDRRVRNSEAENTFGSEDSLLFIDNLISNKCGASKLQKQWQDDGGSGLYPAPSLQSLLRTYLLEDVEIKEKHSLVMYTFLDLATTLDQFKYNQLITNLIKFPVVFKVDSSTIKLTQAFWHLDHGDYATALEELLDPFVLSDDLEPWHHYVALRSLLVNNQQKLALLYMQVRKPSILNERDILIALSLFVANNMLDEAFYFQKHYRNDRNENLLIHLFNECNKHDSIRNLLYRTFDTNEEKTFFKYLRSLQDPSADDLQIFYYLLRSRFVEAFDAHDNTRRKKTECQGLVGQRNVTRSDQVVKIFRNLLPDLNKNLVDTVRHERTNLWKEVSRPTPLSVFVFNSKEQIQYKSTVFNAVLAKSKQTFSDKNLHSSELNSEEIPFLRTPTAFRTSAKVSTPVITPKIIQIDDLGQEDGASPSKRRKLSPRMSISNGSLTEPNISIHDQMHTPMVKRLTPTKLFLATLDSSQINVCTPQSILKVRNLIRQSESSTADDYELMENDMKQNHERTPNVSLGVHGRRSLSRSRPNVHFEDSRISSSDNSFTRTSILHESPKKDEISPLSTTSEWSKHTNTNLVLNKWSPKDEIPLVSSSVTNESLRSTTLRSAHDTSDDSEFYSPNSSWSDSSLKTNEKINKPDEPPPIPLPEVLQTRFEVKEQSSSMPLSPRARKSYKKSIEPQTPIRSSPRLTKTVSTPVQEERIISTPKKLQGRKSLSRLVLENVTFRKHAKTTVAVSEETFASNTEKSIVTETISESVTETTETNQEITESFTNTPNKNSSCWSESDDSDISDLSFIFSPINLPPVPELPACFFEHKNKVSKAIEAENETSSAKIETSEDATPMEIDVYEDLSSAEEDIEEILTKNAKEQQNLDEKDLKVYEDVFSRQIPDNIFESHITEPDYEVIPIESQVKDQKESTKEDDEVIEIGSSSEDEKSNSTENDEEVNIFYEKNISVPNDSCSNSNSGSEETDPDSYSSNPLDRAILSEDSRENSIQVITDDENNESDNSNSSSSQPIGQDVTEVDQFNQGFCGIEEIVEENNGGNLRHVIFKNQEKEEELENFIDDDQEQRKSTDDIQKTKNEESASKEIEKEQRSVNIADCQVLQDSGDEDVELDECKIIDEIVPEQKRKKIQEQYEPSGSDPSKEHEGKEEIGKYQKEMVLEECGITAALSSEQKEKKEDDTVLEPRISSGREKIQKKEKEECNIKHEIQNITTSEQSEEKVQGESCTEQHGGDSEHLECATSTELAVNEDQNTTEIPQPKETMDIGHQDPENTTEIHQPKETMEIGHQEPETEPVKSRSPKPKKSENIPQTNLSKLKISEEQIRNITPKKTRRTSIHTLTDSEALFSSPARNTRSNKIENKTAKLDNEDLSRNIFEETVFPQTPAIRKRRSASFEVKQYTRKNLAPKSRESDVDYSDNIFNEDVFPATPAIRKTRSISVDQLKVYPKHKSRESAEPEVEEKNLFDLGPKTPMIRKRTSSCSTFRSYRKISTDSVQTEDASNVELVEVLPSVKESEQELSELKKMPVVEKQNAEKLLRKRSVSTTSQLHEAEEDGTGSNAGRKRLGSTSTSQLRGSKKKSSLEEETQEKESNEGRRRLGSASSTSQSKKKSMVEEETILVEESYTSARRLTRCQAKMLKENEIDVSKMDPVNLLDKQSFQGPADPEEAKIYESSSPSNSLTDSLKGVKRKSSRSAASDTSTPVSTPTRRSQLSQVQEDSLIPAVIRTRTRTKSAGSISTVETSISLSPKKRRTRNNSKDSESAVEARVSPKKRKTRNNSKDSETSITLSPKKRSTRSKSKEKESENVRSMRTRSNSLPSFQSDSSEVSRPNSKNKKNTVDRKYLPSIEEENSNKPEENVDLPKRTRTSKK